MAQAAARTRIMLRICSATMPTLPSPMAAVSHCGEEGRLWERKACESGMAAGRCAMRGQGAAPKPSFLHLSHAYNNNI